MTRPTDRPVLTGDEQAELIFLRAENTLLRIERDILMKAASGFAAEAGALVHKPEPR
ncbi:hypothetical protein ATK36_5313 [Amycolatopsis sulphurea]|uniref:Transposase n=1 Tax=Amycolatopsis sulphurea TaxID=76022 RepID=A0A2A9FH90_9PSEU|nr:hypothetical protein [Amycolatopsis sulphurea]PFG50111.1 hypothetical protein ATK36_5313 [Amycolatopsis sulphurea]